MKIKNIILIIILNLLSFNAFAQIQKVVCVGMEPNVDNKVWNVILDFKADKIIINGDVFNVSNYNTKENSTAIYTVKFLSDKKIWVYDALIVIGKKFYLAQYSINPHKIVAAIELSCHS